MILFLLFNSLLVFGINNIFNYDYEFTSRISSMCHAVVSLIGSILFITNLIPYNIFHHIINYNIVFISTDIYLYITSKISNKDIKEMMVHHICFLIGCYIASLEPYYYALGIMSEGSTIFLNTRWFAINKYYFKNIELHTKFFWFTFLIFRIFNITYLTYILYNQYYYYYTLLVLPFLLLNYTWFYYLTMNCYLNKNKKINN
jgi:hypothetical protein